MSTELDLAPIKARLREGAGWSEAVKDQYDLIIEVERLRTVLARERLFVSQVYGVSFTSDKDKADVIVKRTGQ